VAVFSEVAEMCFVAEPGRASPLQGPRALDFVSSGVDCRTRANEWKRRYKVCPETLGEMREFSGICCRPWPVANGHAWDLAMPSLVKLSDSSKAVR